MYATTEASTRRAHICICILAVTAPSANCCDRQCHDDIAMNCALVLFLYRLPPVDL